MIPPPLLDCDSWLPAWLGGQRTPWSLCLPPPTCWEAAGPVSQRAPGLTLGHRELLLCLECCCLSGLELVLATGAGVFALLAKEMGGLLPDLPEEDVERRCVGSSLYCGALLLGQWQLWGEGCLGKGYNGDRTSACATPSLSLLLDQQLASG